MPGLPEVLAPALGNRTIRTAMVFAPVAEAMTAWRIEPKRLTAAGEMVLAWHGFAPG